jgi:Tol biopolymer transport system component
MSLPERTRVGPYEILAPLGAGGMGEVYRARDTRLGREVAIKVLPSSFSSDAERLRRFEQEARAAGMLNHPNIVVVHDVGTHEGAPYVVMELLEGETLRARLAGGALPQRKAIEYALQTARGLAAAHEKGIVHRDLKPENLFVTKDGRVKILDFGLAKLNVGATVAVATRPTSCVAAQAGRPHGVAPTLASETAVGPTEPGVVLGTVGYMSPEQVRGQSADHRCDVFSFGAILCEMLSGRRAFYRNTAAETMTAILREEPPELPPSAQVPPALDRIIRHCLEKNPEERFRSAHDLAFALENVSGVSSSAATAAPVAPVPWPSRLRMRWALAMVLVLAIGLAAGFWLHSWHAPAAPSWHGVRLGGPEYAYGPRISPDGQTLAFVALVDGQSQVGVMRRDSGQWAILTRQKRLGSVSGLAWSGDGSKIYFGRLIEGPAGIYDVPAVGGPERLVLESAQCPEVLPDGSLLVVRVNAERNMQLYRFWPETGRVQSLPAENAVNYSYGARAFSDGREAVFFGKPLDQTNAPLHLYSIDLASGRSRKLAPAISADSINRSAYAAHPDGRSAVVAWTAGNLFNIGTVPRDGGSSVQKLLAVTHRTVLLDAAPDGSLYVDEYERPLEVLRFPASAGSPERIATSATYPPGSNAVPLPDGRLLFASQISGRNRILVTQAGADPLPFLETEEETWCPVALLGSQHVVLLLGAAGKQELAIASIAGGRIVRRLTGVKGAEIRRMACSPDAKTIYYTASGSLWAIPASDGAPRKLGAGDAVAVDPRNGDLIVQLSEPERVRLVRLPASGGPPQEIPFRSDLRLTRLLLAPNAVRKDGRIVATVASNDSWWFGVAVLDPRSGRVERIPLNYPADLDYPGWTPDGRIVSAAQALRAALWRFRPVR